MVGVMIDSFVLPKSFASPVKVDSKCIHFSLHLSCHSSYFRSWYLIESPTKISPSFTQNQTKIILALSF